MRHPGEGFKLDQMAGTSRLARYSSKRSTDRCTSNVKIEAVEELKSYTPGDDAMWLALQNRNKINELIRQWNLLIQSGKL